ncbi:MAG: class II aldolase/adducin family protein [Anaerolineales bacterium]
MKTSENQSQRELIAIIQQISKQGLARSSDGNISARVDEQHLLITPSGIYKAWLRSKDLLLVDMDGNPINPYTNKKPTSELFMHLEVYRQRSDVKAVIHAHPPYATALTLVGRAFPADLVPESLIGLGDVPTVPYAPPGNQRLADNIRPYIRTHDVLLLDHHGCLCAGRDLTDALIKLERLESVAQLYWLSHNLGEIIPLPPDELNHLRKLGEKYRQIVE